MKRVIVVVVVIAVVVGGIYYFRTKKAPSKNQKQAYDVEIVRREDLVVKVLATGSIEPFTRVEIRPPVSGRIEEIFVDERARVKVGDNLLRMSSDDRISLIDAARAQLESAMKSKDENAIADAKKALDLAERAFKPIFVKAPISGEIIKRNCQPGQNVYVSDVLFVLADRLVASVEVDEADIAKISLKMPARLNLDAYPDETFLGKVAKISREGRISSGVVVYDVLVEVNPVPENWSAGMTVNAEFLVNEKDNVITISKNLLHERNGKYFVMVLKQGQPTPVPVEIGITDGTRIEITSGLDEGDSVIVSSGSKGAQRYNPSPVGVMRRLSR